MSYKDEVAFDERGFMWDPHQWSTDLAELIAASLGLEGLDYAHIEVIEYLREHYLAHSSVLPAEEVCHALELEAHCIRHLFGDYEKAWKIAGLPDPGTELRELMEDTG